MNCRKVVAGYSEDDDSRFPETLVHSYQTLLHHRWLDSILQGRNRYF